MNLVYHNINTKKYFKLVNKRFQLTTPTKLMYTALPKSAMKVEFVTVDNENLSNNDLKGMLLSKAYDALSDSKNRKYTIKYLKNDIGYNLLMLDKSYIDISPYQYMTYEPLTYTTLFDNGLIKKEINSCFVKIKAEDSFMVFYQNGQYLYSISIDELIKQNILTLFAMDFILELLKKYDESYNKLLTNMVKALASIINEKLAEFFDKFELEVDNIFLDFDALVDSQYVEMFKSIIGEKVEPFSIDPLSSDSSTIILTSMLIKHNNQMLNFKTTQKSANNHTFVQKSVASVLVASAISLAYPAYLAYETVMTRLETIAINKSANEIAQNKKQLLASVKQYMVYKNELDKRLAGMKHDRKEILDNLDDIYQKVDNSKAEILSKLTNKLNITDISIENISLRTENGNNIVSLSLLSPKESRIRYVIDELASYDINKNSIYRYNKNFRANIEVIL